MDHPVAKTVAHSGRLARIGVVHLGFEAAIVGGILKYEDQSLATPDVVPLRNGKQSSELGIHSVEQAGPVGGFGVGQIRIKEKILRLLKAQGMIEFRRRLVGKCP